MNMIDIWKVGLILMKLIKFDTELYRNYQSMFIPIKYNDVVIIDLPSFRYYMINHVDKYFLGDDESESGIERFNFLWIQFVTEHKKMLFDSYDALLLEYNPIENYNSVAEFVHGQHKDVDSDVISKHEGNNISESHPYGYNSNDPPNSEKNFSSFTTNNYTDKHEHDYSSYTDIEQKHGNIGVTTSQQMIKSELELRQYDLKKWFFDLFAHENLFYC